MQTDVLAVFCTVIKNTAEAAGAWRLAYHIMIPWLIISCVRFLYRGNESKYPLVG